VCACACLPARVCVCVCVCGVSVLLVLLSYIDFDHLSASRKPRDEEFMKEASRRDEEFKKSLSSFLLQSEREAIDFFGKDDYDIIFARTSTVKGGGGGTRSAARGTRGGGGSTGGQSEEKIEVQRLLDELHDFRDASGFCTSDWLLQVTVKQHDGKDDEKGEHVDNSRITKRPNLRLYSVDPDLLIRVTVKNMSSTSDISFKPVYVKDNGEEEPEDIVELKSGEDFDLPFPLRKEAGEDEDGWAIKDNEGKTVLKLRFTLTEELVPFANADEQAKVVKAQEMVTAQPQQEVQTLPGTATISLSRNKTSNPAECARLGGAAAGALEEAFAVSVSATASVLACTPSALAAIAAASTPASKATT
jgi:hypothetical protein